MYIVDECKEEEEKRSYGIIGKIVGLKAMTSTAESDVHDTRTCRIWAEDLRGF